MNSAMNSAMNSERLRYTPLGPEHLDAFHALIEDAYVRRYLLDGTLHPRSWSADRIRESQALFDRRGVGLWLVHENQTGALVGFCGMLEMPDVHPEPQLVYALFERSVGNGYATEMGQAVITRARAAGFVEIIASVDEVNTASVRVLDRLGFKRYEIKPGEFGNMLMLRLPAPQG